MPPSGVIIAFKKSAREARSTIGVPMMPMDQIGATEIVCRHRRAHISLPDDAAVYSVERVHIIRFGHRNDRWPAAWPVIDVKRLRVNFAGIVPSKFRSRVRFAAADGVKAESM